MNFNTILLRLGIDPANFVNRQSDPIKTTEGFIYEVQQRTDIRHCPYCNSSKAHIQDHDYVTINCSETDHITDLLRIKKVRFKCCQCGRTYTPEISGISSHSKISNQTKLMIINDFRKSLTFSQIAETYGISVTRVIQIFDEAFPYVPRKKMPEILCIDEIKFDDDPDQKYCCVLYDHKNRQIVDIIKNRQLAYLNEYFSAIPAEERDKVRYFISDMYDGYATVCRKYFKKATHIIDLFHVIVQLTNAVNRLRTIAMNSYDDRRSLFYKFMKAHWKLFLCRRENIPDKLYKPFDSEESYHYSDMVFDSLKQHKDLLYSYNILQDLYHYSDKKNYKEADIFIGYISNRLLDYDNSLLNAVGMTYARWRPGIASAMARTQNRTRLTNAIAESLNNQLKTIIKSAYGYHNFLRFRNRALLIIMSKNKTS